MKNLFSVKTLAAAFIAGGLMFSFSACTEEDPCADIACVNGTLTEVGSACSCVCEAGYEGADCTTVSREKYLSVGEPVTETCGTNTSPAYNIDIVTGDNINQIRFKNLGNYGCSTGDYYVVASVSVVNGVNTVTIAQQTVCATVFAGSGTLVAGVLTINYEATYDPGTGNVTDDCSIIVNL